MNFHEAVLLNEVMHYLQCRPGGIYIDATVGGGGYAEHIIRAIGPEGVFVGIDQDEDALRVCRERFTQFSKALFYKSNFRKLAAVLTDLHIENIDGIVFDLGVSGFQFATPERGFSFAGEGPLDMRMDKQQHMTAAQLINTLPEKELSRIIYTYSQERWAKRIAKAVVHARNLQEIRTTKELADIVAASIPRSHWPRSIHPATRTFQALRIEVNAELTALEEALMAAVAFLRSAGRVVVVSYHSLEDRIVKNTFRELSSACTCPPSFPECRCGQKAVLSVLTKKPIIASSAEIERNPSARSGKLRAAEKI